MRAGAVERVPVNQPFGVKVGPVPAIPSLAHRESREVAKTWMLTRRCYCFEEIGAVCGRVPQFFLKGAQISLFDIISDKI